MSEINTEDQLRRLKEDQLARQHMGYFKLWSMKLSKGRDSGGWSHLPWIKDKLLGTFSSREPCEEFLKLIDWGPWATYTFHRFDRSIDKIPGFWKVEIDRDGAFKFDDRVNFISPKFEIDHWKWKEHGINFESKGDWNNGATFHGVARTKDRAMELAHEAKAEFDAFVRDERPKRAKGCYCDPWAEKLCGKCEDQAKEQRKQDCGCPHCEGDHVRTPLEGLT